MKLGMSFILILMMIETFVMSCLDEEEKANQ